MDLHLNQIESSIPPPPRGAPTIPSKEQARCAALYSSTPPALSRISTYPSTVHNPSNQQIHMRAAQTPLLSAWPISVPFFYKTSGSGIEKERRKIIPSPRPTSVQGASFADALRHGEGGAAGAADFGRVPDGQAGVIGG